MSFLVVFVFINVLVACHYTAEFVCVMLLSITGCVAVAATVGLQLPTIYERWTSSKPELDEHPEFDQLRQQLVKASLRLVRLLLTKCCCFCCVLDAALRCKGNRQYLLTFKLSRYSTLVVHGIAGASITVVSSWCIITCCCLSCLATD